MGCTTIRLAHYQHDQYFYDLCDEVGLVIWAEIPYISNHMPTGRENTISQMKELIVQNYNHPCIVVWGLSNEITMKGQDDPDLLENHHILNDLCHEMDKTRLTTMACVSMCPMDAKIIQIPDVVSYNHYFGWYGGDTSMNGPWFDKFHKLYPNIPIGISEYGCEALNWHTSDPKQGDYTEEYQAYYHEELIKAIHERPYLWATHVWNMYDFGADARAEGGENGQNHKGMMTIDRKYKKDSFYAYKAWLNPEPMVHICGKRYVERVEDVTKVTVYSNQPSVELFANGVSLGVQHHNGLPFFYFDVPNSGVTKLEAVAAELKDESVICKVEQFNEAYRMREQNAVLNWFDITEPEGYLNVNCTFKQIMATLKGKMLMMGIFAKMAPQMSGKGGPGMDMSAMGGLMEMLGGFTFLRLAGMIGTMGIKFTKEELLDINAKLNKIKCKD
jgi:beta-galactosidase